MNLEEVNSNLKQLNYELSDEIDPILENYVKKIGYESLNQGVTVSDGRPGILIQATESDYQYNNGVYLLHRIPDENKIRYVMEVVIPNTQDKSQLIYEKSSEIIRALKGIDFFNLQPYDQMEIWSNIVQSIIINPLTEQFYPDDPIKAERYAELYSTRFLANVAHYTNGDGDLKEELVNSEPYTIKMLIDQHTSTKKEFDALVNNPEDREIIEAE